MHLEPKPERISEKDFRKLQRGAEIQAGLDGYIGHLSSAELKRRIDRFYSIIRRYEKEVEH